jgi:hypothetical protein
MQHLQRLELEREAGGSVVARLLRETLLRFSGQPDATWTPRIANLPGSPGTIQPQMKSKPLHERGATRYAGCDTQGHATQIRDTTPWRTAIQSQN